jgi:hypothetical protein
MEHFFKSKRLQTPKPLRRHPTPSLFAQHAHSPATYGTTSPTLLDLIEKK